MAFGADHSFSIDQCGHVDTISTHVAILTPFYYFPVMILCGLIVVKITSKIQELYSTRLAVWYNLHYIIHTSHIVG